MVVASEFNPDQQKALEAEIENGFSSLPRDIGKVALARLAHVGIQRPGDTKLPRQLYFDELHDEMNPVCAEVYPFLRRAADFADRFEVGMFIDGRYGIYELQKVSSEKVEHRLGTRRLEMPLTAGYWVPETVITRLEDHPGTGAVSPMAHYMRAALIACANREDYDATNRLGRRLTGASMKTRIHGTWLSDEQ